MPEYIVGTVMEYHELGNSGRVQVLGCEHFEMAGSPATRVRLRALEDLTGSRMVVPIPEGHEWDAEMADRYASYCGWSLSPCHDTERRKGDVLSVL
jgi:hypothetical protein